MLGRLRLVRTRSLRGPESATSPLVLMDAWRWRELGWDHGLQGTRVYHIEESVEGTLWVGTDAGLFWYDGFRFHLASGLPLVELISLAPLQGEKMAAFGPSGLAIGDRHGWSSRPTPLDSHEVVKGMCTTSAGEIVLRVRDTQQKSKGVIVGPLDDLARVELPGHLANRPFPSVDTFRGLNGTLVLQKSLVHASGLHGTLVLPENWIVSAALSDPGAGGCLVAVRRPFDVGGLWEVDSARRRRVMGTRHREISGIVVGFGGEALVMLAGRQVLVREPGGRWSAPFTAPRPLHAARCMRFLRSGDLVVGGRDGISLLRRTCVAWSEQVAEHPEKTSRFIRAMHEDRDGNLWLCSELGLECHRSDGTHEVFNRLAGRRMHGASAIAEDGQGRIWIGDDSGSLNGLIILDAGRVEHRSGPDVPRSVRRLRADREGHMWVLGRRATGPLGGVWIDDGDGLQPVSLPASLKVGPRHRDVAFTTDGAVWYASPRGLSRYLDGRWRMTPSPRRGSNHAISVIDDGGTGVWFAHGNSGGGLWHANADGELREALTHLGTSAPRVHDLDLDSEGRLWVAAQDELMVVIAGVLCSACDRSLPLTCVRAQGPNVVVGTRGLGAHRFDLAATNRWGMELDTQLSVVGGTAAAVSWNPIAEWNHRPSAKILTRYRLDTGPWSPWSTDRLAKFSALEEGERQVTIEVLPRSGAGPATLGRVPFDIHGPVGGPRVLLACSAPHGGGPRSVLLVDHSLDPRSPGTSGRDPALSAIRRTRARRILADGLENLRIPLLQPGL